jgi:hypothetical protein
MVGIGQRSDLASGVMPLQVCYRFRLNELARDFERISVAKL